MTAHYTVNHEKEHPGFTELVSQTQVEREIEISHNVICNVYISFTN